MKPIFGVPPQRYLLAFYGALLLGLIFFVFVFPGLWKSGALVSFQVQPPGAAVVVDGQRQGFAPGEFFIPRGQRQLLIKKPHFAPREMEVAVPGRLLGSLFFPKRISITAELDLASPEELLAAAHRDFSAWVMAGSVSPAPGTPALLAEAASDYLASPQADPERLRQMLRSAAASVDSPAALEDYLQAVLLAGSEGGPGNAQALERSARFLVELYQDGGDAAADWLARILPEDQAAALIAAEAGSAAPRPQADSGEASPMPPAPRGLPVYIRTPGGEFARIPGGSFVPGAGNIGTGNTGGRAPTGAPEGTAPRRSMRIDSFYLKTQLVSEGEFAAFIREEPRWAPANRNQLVRDGLAEESYLASWADSPQAPRPELPVREVSQAAARAYCDWLSAKDPRYRYYLPGEWDWEYAALLNQSPPPALAAENGPGDAAVGPRGRLGLRFMGGMLWEWCGGGFYPASPAFLPTGDFPAAEEPVRGGSWLNPPSAVGPATRGSQPATWCTPYLGFRPAAQARQ